jgi:hypothetical protein
MRRIVFCLMALTVAGAARAQAQTQECRRYAGGTVVICDRHRVREVREYRRRYERAPVELGVRGGYDFRDDQGSLGTQVRLPVVRQFAVAPSFDVFFGDAGARWQLNLDGLVRPEQLGGLYFGGGGALIRREFDPADGTDTRLGWNLLAGIDGGRVSGTVVRPFAEARWTGTGDFTGFRLVGGVNVPIAGHLWR